MTKTWPRVTCWEPGDALAMVTIEAGTPDQANDVNRGDHVFLAGHQAPAMKYLEEAEFLVNRGGSRSSQEQVLAKISDRSRPMLFITGAPGTGKSHLVRWLHIHATAETDVDGRKDLFAHVPRSMTNLADVLQVILEHAEASEREAIREKIAEATGELKSDKALRQRLLMTLSLRLSELREEIEAQGASHQFGKRAYHEVLLLLPDFLAAGEARALYAQDGGPADRIVRVRLQQRGEGEDVADVQLRFTREDVLAGGRLAELHDAAFGQKDAECRARLIGESDFMERALELMDYCVDGAVRELVGLDATQLQSAMGRLLASLEKKGQRLVLFFEDWGLIAGFQNQLAEAFAAAKGGSALAVIAITSQRLGQFPGNILERGWIYSLDRTDDEQRRAAVDDLLARNMNAIRHGPTRLRAMFDGRSDEAWLNNACDECPFDAKAACHTSFGAVEVAGIGQVGLFPMTRESITAAILKKFGAERDPVPRIVLSGILRVVLEHRTADELKAGIFPTKQFAEEFAPAEFRLALDEQRLVQRALEDAGKSEQSERWIAFLETYRSRTRLNSHSTAAAEALGLTRIPDIAPVDGEQSEESGPTPGGKEAARAQHPPVAQQQNLKPSAAMDSADAFQRGRQIANEDVIRKVVAGAIRSAMSTDGHSNDDAWDDAPDGIDSNDIGINGPSRSGRPIEVRLDAASHGHIVRGLVNLNEGGSWGQLELPRDRRLNAEQTVDSWARIVEESLLGDSYERDVAALLRLLIITGIAWGHAARVNEMNALSVALEAPPRQNVAAIPPDSLRDPGIRATAQSMLLRRIAFAQGRGAPVAVDIARLAPILATVLADLRLPTPEELPSTTPDKVVAAVREMEGDLETRTGGLVKHLEAWWTVNGGDAPNLDRIEELIAAEERLSAQLPHHAAGQSKAVRDTLSTIRRQRVEVADMVRWADEKGLLSLIVEMPTQIEALKAMSLAERLSLSIEFDQVRPLMTSLQQYFIGVRTLVEGVAQKQAGGSGQSGGSLPSVPEPPIERATELAKWAAKHAKKGTRRGA